MTIKHPTRRELLTLMAGGMAAGSMALSPLGAVARRVQAMVQPRFKAVAFDGFTIFDPRPIFALVEKFFPGQGTEFGRVWRNKQFDYAWLRLLSGDYEDFWTITQDALTYSAHMLKVDLTADKRKQLLDACLTLKPWPDVPLALTSLKGMGVRLAFLSNFTPEMLESNLKSSKLEGTFDTIISTCTDKTYKPDPKAYHMAMDALKLERQDILFAPFAGWDAAGAKKFGYTTFWVDRINLPPEELGATPDATGETLADLVRFMKNV